MASITERSLKDGTKVYKITVFVEENKDEGGKMVRRCMTVRPEPGKKTIKKTELDRMVIDFENKWRAKQLEGPITKGSRIDGMTVSRQI